MPVLRFLLIVLVVLNLAALAASRGWLGTTEPRGEPERITNQINPDRVVLRPAESPPAAPQAAPEPPPAAEAPADTAAEAAGATAAAAEPAPPQACATYSGLTEQQADALEAEARAAAGGLRTARSLTSTPKSWWVRLPPSANRSAAERKVSELKALGINDYFIIQEPGPNQFAVSLGLFKSEAAAKQHLAYLQGKQVRDAGIAPRNGVIHRVEIRGPGTALAPLADALAAKLPAAIRAECKP